jgi:uncharacterized protein (UPF0548 family)
MFLLARPSRRDIDAFVAASRDVPLSYGPVGLARERANPGWNADEHEAVIGTGEEAFRRATRALMAWRHFDLGWTELFPRSASIESGSVVAVLVHHLGFWSLNGCRVVYGVGDAGASEFGFAYGTLMNHAECGEEIFAVRRDPHSGRVSYSIRAVSRPNAALAKLGHPIARRLQARFRAGSADAMKQAVMPEQP